MSVVSMGLWFAVQTAAPTVGAASGVGGDSIAVALRAEAPRLDGQLNEAAWSQARPITQFIQREPSEGTPGSLSTQARVIFTDDAIYVGIRAFDPTPELIMAPLARRDQRPVGDWVGIMIDPHHDRRTAYEFAVNPAGVRRDEYRFNDFETDPSWDAVWEAAVARDPDGWTAEVWIPLSQLRFAARDSLRFGFNLYREIGRLHEVQYWRLLARNDRGVVSRFGDLIGLDGLRPPRSLEIIPFVAGRAESGDQQASPGTGGADIRLGFGSGTLLASVNPDFGQVEADPAVVNLSPTEVFFPERRPLFVEGAEYFRFPLTADSLDSDGMLYTRRIGRVPQLGGGPRADPATIVAATKLIGRTPTGWSMALLGALTAEETAAGRISEPRAFFAAGRLARDFNQGRTLLGSFATLVRRDLPPGGATLHTSAVTFALTASHRFGSHLIRVLAAGSRVGGSAEAITLTQRSAVHFFQRPDIDYASVDSTRASLSGAAGWIELARNRGSWLWSIKAVSRSPGFEANDAGFLAEAGRHFSRGNLVRRWLTPGRWFRRSEISLEAFADADFDGRLTGIGAGIRGGATLSSYASLAAEAWRNFGGIDPLALEGGPALARPGNYFFKIAAASSPNRRLTAGGEVVFRPRDQDVSDEFRLNGKLGWRPSSRWDLELSPAYETLRHREQFVAGGGGEFVVGHLHQRLLRVGFRVAYAFSPVITLQAYAEPFATTGNFSGFFRVLDPAALQPSRRTASLSGPQVQRDSAQLSFDLDRDGTADVVAPVPDFSVLSLRSTVVLRWEYRAGSTASLVFQHERDESNMLGDDSPLALLRRLSSAVPFTRVLLKISYRWSP
jgi:Domain of unknown function (DUF5916)/Carbohydrate family 9 binding domain-like